MTHPFEATLNEIEAGLEGVTPGPWKTHLVDDTTIVAPDRTVVATTCDSAETEREDGYNIEYERMERDAAHIARCLPLNMAEMIRLARLGMAVEQAGFSGVMLNRIDRVSEAAIAELQRRRQETDNG